MKLSLPYRLLCAKENEASKKRDKYRIFFSFMVIDSFPGNSSLKSHAILISLTLCVICPFSLVAFNILSLFCALGVLTIM